MTTDREILQSLTLKLLDLAKLEPKERIPELDRMFDDVKPVAMAQLVVRLPPTDDPEVAAALIDLLGLAVDRDPDVLSTFLEQVNCFLDKFTDNGDVEWSAGNAMYGWQEPATLPILLRLAESNDGDVRWKTAVDLPGVLQSELVEPALEALIRLTQDEDDGVRDWATHSLATQVKFDNERIRQSLRDRLDDPYPDVTAEALIGLARRNPDEVFDRIERDLNNPEVGTGAVLAAWLSDNVGHLDALESLKQTGWDEDVEMLDSAIQELRLKRAN